MGRTTPPENRPGPRQVLRDWFDLPHKDERDDETVREKLGPLHQPAHEGAFDEWAETPHGRLALILLLDQVPRHIFRGTPRQYRSDEKARFLARYFFEHGFPDAFTPLEQFYAALPYLHAPDLDKQNRVNPIMHRVARRIPALEFMGEVADRYREAIRRFGRFPHRNDILGRETTEEERAFLGDSFRR